MDPSQTNVGPKYVSNTHINLPQESIEAHIISDRPDPASELCREIIIDIIWAIAKEKGSDNENDDTVPKQQHGEVNGQNLHQRFLYCS